MRAQAGRSRARAMTMGEQLRWWGAGFVVLCLVLWLLAESLTPFVLGAAIAYLTDPLADRLERLGLSRLLATVAITLGAMGAAVVAVLLVVPALVEQVRAVIENAPAYVERLRLFLETTLPQLSDASGVLRRGLDTFSGRVEGWSVSVIQKILSGGIAVIDFVLVLFITPVVAFYLLHDWDRIVTHLDDAAPRQHRAVIRRLASELDDVLAGFVRGQLTVCAILGIFYAVALSLVGLQFGLLVGAFAGLISFIPFVGSILGGTISIGIALAQFWGEWHLVAAVAAIFAAGQAAEGNFLTPKLVGGHVKLHPVWLMFALSAFGSLMGFSGMLIAVPAAAAIGVLVRFLLEQYKTGRLYQGSAEWQQAEARARALASAGEGTAGALPAADEGTAPESAR
ncbi:AI-2E family transporter [Limibaculum sp. FT325]|nr:AI-2E family transporter [Limibaculum sediminis]